MTGWTTPFGIVVDVVDVEVESSNIMIGIYIKKERTEKRIVIKFVRINLLNHFKKIK